MFDDYYSLRAELVAALERDLVGPDAQDELLTVAPIVRYKSGILFPMNAGYVSGLEYVASDDVADGDDEGDAFEPEVSLSSMRYPSSLGLSFAIDTHVANEIRVRTSAARYEAVEPTAGIDDLPIDPSLGKRAIPKHRMSWQRVPLELPELSVSTTTAVEGDRRELEPGLEVFIRVRSVDADGRASITLALLNTRASAEGFGRDADSYFQCAIEVDAVSPRSAFVHRARANADIADDDLRSNNLLYREVVSIAAGHGTSVAWSSDPTEPARATAVRTCSVPQFELRLSDSNPDIDTKSLGMADLDRRPRSESLGALQQLCTRYEAWTSDLSNQVALLDPSHQAVAATHIARCVEAASRMRRGIDVLESDSDAWEAFRIANRAMVMQRQRSDWLTAGAEGAIDTSSVHEWRPFQIAFILLCLEGVAKDDATDRELTDLLWFPTGGGKTEAYLGLLAFTTALRRLRDPERGHGVTVIMRYTLRLLTIQQFERATALICALEAIRRDDERLGAKAIEIGLWVGRAATPNTRTEAQTAKDKLRLGERLETKNPLQLHRCPWCGNSLGGKNIWLAKSPARVVIGCRNNDCIFNDGLPIRTVDEDIYDFHPTLIIATADKFASMPWREQCRSLFNLDLSEVRPPDLIIQDELHLISGPLGTLAGLYETAIDVLCTRNGFRPKVVASTATIRRASAQSRGLFDREVRQFPPPGVSTADSFFAVEAPAHEKGTRLYVGVMAPATSQATLLVRTYAALLQTVSAASATPPVKDPYWTLLGYFNSLRVLGAARMQVQDDVDDQLQVVANRGGDSKREIPADRRIEMTSRVSSTEIPDHLRRMAISYPDDDALDVILATNMISVGVDVNRLGLMAVMGQPQSTSEYIQATSRVGRRYPGLVVTMLNAGKSRDRSHYEAFRDFHGSLYRQVESTSVTPFSARARSRGLHAVLIALARLTIPELQKNDAARDVAQHVSELTNLRDQIVARVRRVDPAEAAATSSELDQIIAAWVRKAADEPELRYSLERQPEKSLLGEAALAGEDFRSVFPTLWSLRDVDRSSNLYQVI